MRVRAVLVCLMLAGAVSAPATDLESEARELEAMLVAPCCWTQQVSVHQSEAAAQIKQEIRASLRDGRTRQEILDAYVARYGTRILIQPPVKGFSAMLYVLPVVALVLSAGGVAWIVRRFTRRPVEATLAAADGYAPSEAGDALNARLEEELEEMD